MWGRVCLRSRPASRLQRYPWSLMQTSQVFKAVCKLLLNVHAHLSWPLICRSAGKGVAVLMSDLLMAVLYLLVDTKASAEVPSTSL